MLEHINLTRSLARKKYNKEMPALQARLHALQRACDVARLSTLIVFEGWDTAGKGTAIKKLTERLEPRAMEIHATREARTRDGGLLRRVQDEVVREMTRYRLSWNPQLPDHPRIAADMVRTCGYRSETRHLPRTFPPVRSPFVCREAESRWQIQSRSL